jgi:serine protease Do
MGRGHRPSRGLDQTVTQGIISAKHRRGITDPSSYQDFLQTDAAINPGNSGGPLINLKGEVIGINSIIASDSGGYEGIGFAIPSNLAVSISKALIAFGKVKRGWIGITIQDLDPEKIKPLEMDGLRGAGVVDVIKGGPADKGGMKKGDIITKLDGREVTDSGSLRNQIAGTPIGKAIQADVLRVDKETKVHIIVGDLDDSLKFLSGVVKDRLGMEVRPLRTQEADSYGIDAGVAVKWLDPKGPMAEAGFEAGDIILEIDGQSVQGVDDFTGMVSVLQPMQESCFSRTGPQEWTEHVCAGKNPLRKALRSYPSEAPLASDGSYCARIREPYPPRASMIRLPPFSSIRLSYGLQIMRLQSLCDSMLIAKKHL